MRLRRLLAVGAAGVAAVLGITTAAGAMPGSGTTVAPDSLRALAAKIGLRIGTAVIPFDLDHPAYQAIVAGQFSVVTPGNEMKWQVVEPTQGTFDWSGADRLVAFAEQHGQLVRGHTLLWHSQLPGWLTSGVDNGTISNAQLRDLLHQHFYNDYNIAGEDGTNAKSDAVFAWLKQMLAQDVPINGVGDQGHLDTQFGFSGTQMTQDLQRYASLGLKVAITEADVRTFVNNATDQVPTDHLATFAQPDEFGQMLKACLAVRQCISFTVWGFGDADSWVPGFFTGEGYATIYDVNLNPKPAYTELQQDLRLAAFGAPHRVPTGAGL